MRKTKKNKVNHKNSDTKKRSTKRTTAQKEAEKKTPLPKNQSVQKKLGKNKPTVQKTNSDNKKQKTNKKIKHNLSDKNNTHVNQTADINENLIKIIATSNMLEEEKTTKIHNTEKNKNLSTAPTEASDDDVQVLKKRRKRKKKVKTWEEKAKQLPTFEVSNYPKLPVKNILITQAKPSELQNPYQLLIDKYKVQIHFRPFIKVEGLTAQEFRNQKVDVLEYTGIIFTSRLAIDHFFRITHEMRVTLPDTTRFFCLNEQIAYYMQKYMELRKRRIFWGLGPIDDLKSILKKHPGGKILLPASDTIREKVIGILDSINLQYSAVDVYKTVPEDISDLKPEKFDMMAFFTPIAVEALHKYFPNFKQNKTRFAAYSILTANKLKELGYRIDIYAPTLEFPSMVNAIAHYLLHIKEKK